MNESIADERRAAQQLRVLEKARKAAAAKRERVRREAPRRLKQIERDLVALSKEYNELPAFPEGRERRRQIRAEIRDLNQERQRLAFGPTNRG